MNRVNMLGIMYRTPVIIGKISPDTCFALKRLIFDKTGDVLYIITLITRLLAKTKKLLSSHSVCFYNYL